MSVKPLVLRTGFTLFLCAWLLGPLLLVAGNAYFGIGGQAPTAHTANMHGDDRAYAHESGTGRARSKCDI